jgi:hypothetical protein
MKNSKEGERGKKWTSTYDSKYPVPVQGGREENVEDES